MAGEPNREAVHAGARRRWFDGGARDPFGARGVLFPCAGSLRGGVAVSGGPATACAILAGMKLASVILDIPTQALDAPYAYVVPDDAPDDGLAVEVGCAVLVPFGHRQAVGFVVRIKEHAGSALPDGLDPAKLKPIVRAVSRAYFDEEGAACAQWLSERYLAPLSSCVRLFTPPGGVPRMVRSREGYWRLEEPAVGEVDDRWVVPGERFGEFSPRKNAVKQASIVEALRAGELRVAELTAEFGAVSAPLKALEKQGVVRIEHRRRMRGFQALPACRPPEPLDAAASPGTRSRGDAGGSRTEVRFASAIPTISGTGETLADLGGPVSGGTGKALADLGGPAVETDEPARTGGAS